MTTFCSLFRKFIRECIQWATLPAAPGFMYVHLEDLGMSNRFEVFVSLPPLAAGEAGEVVKRSLTTIINGGEPVVTDIDVSLVETSFEAKQDDNITLELRNIDDANNIGEPTSYSFVVLDTTAPAAPGDFQVRYEEIPDAPAPETPPV